MARHLWAKIRVDMRHHPKLLGRPDSDFRLWASLILHAKEHCPDGVVRCMSAADMRGAWGIKAPAENVRKALAYFEKSGMLIRQSDDGLLIKDFLDEQRPQKDSPEAALERKRRQRDKERSVTGGVTGTTDRDITRDTNRDPSVTCHAEAEEEEEAEKEAVVQIPIATDGPAAASWDQKLLARLREAFRVTELTSRDFADFLLTASRYPKTQREAATEEFLARNCPAAGKGFGYLLRMIQGGAAPPRPVQTAAGNGAGSYVVPADDDGSEKANKQKAATRKLLDDMRAQEKANAGVVVRHGRNGKS